METQKTVKTKTVGMDEVVEATGVTADEIYAIRTYIYQRLGGNVDFDLSTIKGYQNEQATFESKPLDKKTLGIFGLALKTCVVTVRIWAESKIAEVGVSYKHADGGSNGCSLGIRVKFDKRNVYEMQ